MENTITSPLMSVEELARLLNVKPSWVYGQVAKREIPHIHVGRYPRFVKDDVLRWLRGDGQ